MWKCKKCGGTHFNIWFIGYMEADFDDEKDTRYRNFYGRSK